MHKNSVVRILIVDNHPVVRAGLMGLVERSQNLSVCGDVGSAEEALEILPELHPDMMIVAISLKGMDGLELIKRTKGLLPDIRILVFSMHNELLYAERALRAGAHGYVMKHADPDRLLSAIRSILDGNLHISPRVQTHLIKRSVCGEGGLGVSRLQRLSDRELEVLQFIAHGMTTREIAAILHLSKKTVSSHRENLKKKLQLDNTVQLVEFAVEWAHGGEQL